MTPETTSPRISCILPTFNRRRFVPLAIEYFRRQDYESKELIVVDDGDDPVGDLVPTDERIRYLRLDQKLTVGAKRNLACEQARGEIIAHWDDDDWHAPSRLRYQAEALLRERAEVCGLATLLFYDLIHQRAWQYIYPKSGRFWLSGSTLCYTKAFWASHRFESINVGEDARFVWSGNAGRMITLADPAFHVGIIHDHNVSPKQTGGAYWRPFPVETIRQLLGSDWVHYGEAINSPQPIHVDPRPEPRRSGARSTHTEHLPSLPISKRDFKMITVAKQSDLTLPEFAAFNHGQSLPWMRRWELPFALFQAHLSNTMAVLDCTINPVNFQERLARLYPHILYRHWNPIQNGRFALPFGVPDESFDRVICVNTLEHLLQPQREALIGALAHKLKPGGWLALTSDYYFDSSWEQPAFLRAGIMRADRQEVFNGWNKVTPQEWLEICRRHGLHPLSERVETPQETDPDLYRQQPPFPHACMAGVFCKGPRADVLSGKKILLALLSWNMREVTVDSARAYLREAHMLQRLGQAPVICVCDNGSTDGTADALRALEPDLDMPYKFIFNRANLGNSIARNQIIQAMLEFDADYVLFMDGDIEIVPFSSFAMLRYMENCGQQLGCIGADSTGQTPDRARATPYLYCIDGLRRETTNLVAWTQYGMFRRAVFEAGIRFEEAEPFDQAGWGFEDNDLAFQMELKGYLNQRFFGMTYLHRNARSSIQIMHRLGIDAHALYEKRKRYVIDKWSGVPLINNGPLGDVRRVNMRL